MVLLGLCCCTTEELPQPIGKNTSIGGTETLYEVRVENTDFSATATHLDVDGSRVLACGVRGRRPGAVHIKLSWYDGSRSILNSNVVSMLERDLTLNRLVDPELDGTHTPGKDEISNYRTSLAIELDVAPTAARCVVTPPTGRGGCIGVGCN